jgi:hypothetical protein
VIEYNRLLQDREKFIFQFMKSYVRIFWIIPVVNIVVGFIYVMNILAWNLKGRTTLEMRAQVGRN